MINTKAALDITKTMICSVINYGNIFLSSCDNFDLDEIVQNHALRCSYSIKNQIDVHIVDLHVKANRSFVNVRRKMLKQILTCSWRNIKGNRAIKDLQFRFLFNFHKLKTYMRTLQKRIENQGSPCKLLSYCSIDIGGCFF